MKNILFAFFAGCAICAFADYSNTWTNRVATGWRSWNDAVNWDANGVPSTDGTADVYFAYQGGDTGSRSVQIDSPVSVRSITMKERKSDSVTIGSNGAADGKLTIGAGGMTLIPATKAESTITELDAGKVAGMQPYLKVPIHLAASQTWDDGSFRGSQSGNYRTISGDLSSEEDVVWNLVGWYKYQFIAGSSKNFKGETHVQQPIAFLGTNQFDRLGSTVYFEKTNTVNTLAGHPMFFFTAKPDETVAKVPFAIRMNILNNCDTATYTKGSEKYNLIFNVNGMCATNDFRLLVDQPWSGRVYQGSLNFGSGYWGFSTIHPQNRLGAMRIVLDGDNSQLFKQDGVNQPSGYVRALLELCNNNALSKNNQFGCQLGFEFAGATSGITGVLARPGVTVKGGISPSYVNGNCQGILGYSVLGASQSGEEVLFTGNLSNGYEHGKVYYYYGTIYRLYAPKGGKARFTGTINTVSVPWPVEINGGGDITLSNTGNNIPGGLEIRGGRAIMTAGGDVAGGASRPVRLGGTVPFCYEVKAMVAMPFESPTGAYLVCYDVTTGGVTYPGKYLAVQSNCNNDYDGMAAELQVGDLILVNVPQTYQTTRKRTCNLDTGTWGTESDTCEYVYNGIYRYLGKNVGVHTGRMFERIETMDTYEEINRQAHGIRAKVTGGRKFAGTTWFQATRSEYFRGYLATKTTASPCYWTFDRTTYTEINKQTKVAETVTATGQYMNFQFHEEAEPEPETAIMIGAADVTLANGVLVLDNKTTAASQVGSTVAGDVTFSGTVTLSKDVTFAPAAEGRVLLTGSVVNDADHLSAGMIGAGAGETDLTAADLTGVPTLTAASGTTTITPEQAAALSLGWRFDGCKTGLINISGDIDLTGVTIRLESFGRLGSGMSVPLLTSTGTITGAPTAAGLRRGDSFEIVDNCLYLRHKSLGAAVFVK